ncbi:MAG: hypothetical protein RLZZ292_739 [Bacteroidota bacterium]|jgi:hypothetical protein
MAKFVIHKKGFFYTDESLAPANGKHGSIVGTFDTLEEAKIKKEEMEISSIQKLRRMNVVDFLFGSPKYDDIYEKLEIYFKSEFDTILTDKYFFEFPNEITPKQAVFFKETMELSFHDIVEYAEDKELNSEDFDLGQYELDEF